MGHRKELEGKRFDKLFVTARTNKRESGSIVWKCLCNCGNITFATTSNLIAGRKRSCGCLQKEVAKELGSLSKGIAALNSAFRGYRGNAKIRKLPFELTKEQFIKITQENCRYCGDSPSNVSARGTNGVFIYNGIDRIDSIIGYTEENCVPCCKVCNRAKSSMSINDFLEWIDSLVKYRENL
jgi:hypothetical protein